MLIEANWGNFRAKFNGREEENFEFLCSLLFFKEHNKPTGALRYLNQAGVETEPVTAASDVVGWQAKFLGSSAAIGKNKKKLIKAIDNAKARHPTLTRIHFYLNVDFPTNTRRGKEPSYKKEVEAHAKAKGVDVVWRTASFFETPFVCETNANIARHFFELGPSVFAFLQELARHTDAVLAPIRSEIVFQGATIKIDRSAIVRLLHDTLSASPLMIVSGEAGVGKTAIVKDLHAKLSGNAPFFVFKATEFNVAHINQLFTEYGPFTLDDLVQEYEHVAEKFIVIDSAEKLAELDRPEVFQEGLFKLKSAGWKIVFTTRLSYLEYLKYVFAEVYNAAFEPLNVPNLTAEELGALSSTHKFSLPGNERFRDLLRNPFYLNEYLRTNPTGDPETSYSAFREAIWNSQVVKISYQKGNAHRKREECFLELARRRASSGRFFVAVDGFDEALQQLEADEIIKFESSAGGYFITHDIYEEWALERVIERAFRTLTAAPDFYEDIGDSLAIRRAFRGWLTDKLAAEDAGAARLIQDTVSNSEVPRHWQDEAIVAALHSTYSTAFVSSVEKALLALPPQTGDFDDSQRSAVNDSSLLYRVLFLLRIACKEVDQAMLAALGANKAEGFTFSSLITRPQGSGWTAVIKFLNSNRDALRLQYMHLILPVLDDWNRYNKHGDTTKAAGQLALFYFNELTKSGHFPFGRRDETKERLISVIFNGATEISEDLAKIFGDVVKTKAIGRESRYYELATAALGPLLESANVARALPKEVIELAQLFWPYTPPTRTDGYPDHRMDIEQYFDLEDDHHEFYPTSAYQTPTLALLQTAPKAALDFILWLTNRSVEFFARTEFAKHEVEETNLVVDSGKAPIKQYVCHRIWNIFRGTQVAPAVLECMHMALEHWLLGVARIAPRESLEPWCWHLLRNSRSASITALVVSVVLAQPSKLFNVALALFRSKDFFFYDTARMQLDSSAKSHYAISYDPAGIYTKERLETCDHKHRQQSLEHLALHYQLFRDEGETEAQAKERQDAIWKVLDQHYAALPSSDRETDEDKKWRLCLARMDRRKMTITTESKDSKVFIQFNPDIDPELRKYSEDALAKNAETTKYIPLNLWARHKYERNESEFKKYPQYENDPARALSDCRTVVEGLSNDPDSEFTLFYRALAPTTCAVLIRDFAGVLDADGQAFCREVLLKYASRSFQTDYRYQIGDGVDAALDALPYLLKASPKSRDEVRRALLFTLLDNQPAGMGQRFSDHSVSAIRNLWSENAADAQALFLGFLYLKPKFDALWERMRQRRFQDGMHPFSTLSLFQQFDKEHHKDIAEGISGKVSYDDLSSANDVTLDTLVTGVLLLPLETTDQRHTLFMREAAVRVVQEMTKRDRAEDRFDPAARHRFLRRFAGFVLSREPEDVTTYVQPFVESLIKLNHGDEVFQQFLSAQVELNRYDSFWKVWDLFYPSVVKLARKGGSGRRSSEVIHNYLFAWPYWRKGIKGWDTLKDREKVFFKRVAEDIGDDPDVLYALAKALNEVAAPFEAEGIFWISGVIERNPRIADAELETDAIYYLENFVRGYVLRNRHKVRTTPQVKERVLVILNFLLQKASVTAYLIREDIL